MPFDIPLPSAILSRLQAEADILLPGSDSRLRRSPEGVLTRLITMSSHEHFGYLMWLADQLLPDTAESEWLDRHGDIWGITRKSAASATGKASFNGTNGSVIPSATIVKRNDEVLYQTISDITIAAGVGVGFVTALSPSANGNAVINTRLSLVSPVTGVQVEGLVIDDGSGSGLSGGTDIEGDDSYRNRIIERIQEMPMGGSDADYVRWAKMVPGVTRAWTFGKQLGLGTVVVIVVMDDKTDTFIPSSTELEGIQDFFETVRPTTADVTVVAPTPVAVNFNIGISPSSAAIQNAIKAELQDFFKREAIPGGKLYLSRIREVISVAAGEHHHNLVSPSADIERTFGQISVLGVITWGAIA